ncbi:MAG: sensor histidine kinase [Elainellaceae cyanobacterium]
MASFDPVFRYKLSASLFQHLRDSFHQIYQFVDANRPQSVRYVVTEASLDLDPSTLEHLDHFSLVVSDHFSALLVAQQIPHASAHRHQVPTADEYAIDVVDGQAVAQFLDWLIERVPPESAHFPTLQQMRQSLGPSQVGVHSLLVQLLLERLSQVERHLIAQSSVVPQSVANPVRHGESYTSALPPRSRQIGTSDHRHGLSPSVPAVPTMPTAHAVPVAPAAAANASSLKATAVGHVLERAEARHAEAQHARSERAEPDHQKAERAKNVFLAAINHELRTPLTYILGMSTTLLRWVDNASDAAIRQQQRHYLESIYNQGKHLLEMINGILDLSQSELGQMTLDIQQVSLSALLQECIGDYHAEAENRDITLTLEAHPSLEEDSTAADPHRLRQIVAILLSNAIKFTPAGGQVTVRLTFGDAEVNIQVEDTGIGIAEQHRSIIFQKFKQLDDSYHRQYEGTGMGLALAKQLIELHDGHVYCESTVNVGTTFTVRLPRRQATETSERYLAPPRAVSRSRRRILLIDGQGHSAQAIADGVAGADCQLIWILNGYHALEQVDALQPDLIIVGACPMAIASRDLIYGLRQTQIGSRVQIAAVDDGRAAEDLPSQHHYRSLGMDSLLKTPADLAAFINPLGQG